MKILMAAVAALLSLTIVSPASATRMIPGYHYPDVCKNIKGKQPIYLVVGAGPYDFNESTSYKWDCVKVSK